MSSLAKQRCPLVSLIGVAALKQLMDAGEKVYTINIQPTSDYQDIKPCEPSGKTPAPTTALQL